MSNLSTSLKSLVNLGANLLDPENVKQVIGKHNIKNGAKLQYVYAYSAFLKMLKMSWNPTKYKQEEMLPFIPDKSELDQLIASYRSRRVAACLQCLKETYADPGEALKLRWIDISGSIITINKPVKGHSPRQIEVSKKLISMLNSLQRHQTEFSQQPIKLCLAVMMKCKREQQNYRKTHGYCQFSCELSDIEAALLKHITPTAIF